MTPQSSFMILAPVAAQREAELRTLFASMNHEPGRVDPNNAVVPFAQFDTLHFARLLILDDRTLGDVTAYGVRNRTYPLYFTFMADLDGDRETAFRELATRAEAGLRAIFACCEGFAPGTDLVRWMQSHDVPSATTYVNWKGRTMQQTREEAALREAVGRHLDENGAALAGQPASEVRAGLRRFVDTEVAAGRVTLTPEAPPPPGWALRDRLHLIGVPLLLALTSPLVLIAGAILLVRVRMQETTDPELCFRADPAYADALAELEDHDVTNVFSAMGTLKPGLIRRWTASFVLWFVDYTTRHVYTRGRLARVQTIHFARWVWLDDKRRLLFCSNYDGSLDSYMDDFINKVGFGLNVVFSNGVGYPRTQWLVRGGAKDEQKFKNFLRRHQMPTQVWYDAHSGVTACELARNARIRAGLEAPALTQAEARAWVALL